ncbi:MAG TPA: PQQ-binding-like beta-propeller repeat protein [Thermoguttaceae bacterium]|nr:PQQ-binding-like beta-propeller repeat protein [Thermoguttaceae bacterium]
MRQRSLPLALALFALAACSGSDWLHFRGTDNRSVSDEKNLPKTFGDEENVAWKVPLPGRGPSCPIVVGGRVVVTCSSGPRQDRLHVLSFDAATGKLQWERQLWATGSTICNPYGAVADNTPASDGRLIFAFYSSNDLACFDLEGNLKWLRGLTYDHPTTRNEASMASSPLVLGEVVVVQLENQGESFVAGIDVATGATRWRLDRPADAVWCSPTVLRGKTREDDIVLLQTRGRFTGHDPRTGEELWLYEADCHTIASCTTCGACVYLPANGLHALRYDPTARSVELLWYEQRLRGGNSSPVVHDGRVYRIKSPAILVCADAADGRILWQLRLKGAIWATPVAADGHLYAVNHDGLVHVVRLGEKGELVGTSQIDSGILASPAVADGAIYFRSDAHLWKVAFPRASEANP